MLIPTDAADITLIVGVVFIAKDVVVDGRINDDGHVQGRAVQVLVQRAAAVGGGADFVVAAVIAVAVKLTVDGWRCGHGV